MDRLTTGEGTIEMIRKTPEGRVEEFSILGNQLIDGNGTWCYQIPMNLDYVRTDEYGNIVQTNDTKKGLPTRARVRFRFSLTDFESDYVNNHLSKMLVPNNPRSVEDMAENYVFGTKTHDSEFRDLFWNKVYSVKSYIPRLQKSNFYRDHRFSGIKAVNVNDGNNPIPYNNLRIDITFMFVLQCAIMHTLIWIAGVVNRIISWLMGIDKTICSVDLGKEIAKNFTDGACITVGDGACPDLEGWYFAPRCRNKTFWGLVNPLEETYKKLAEKEGIEISNGTQTYSNANPHRNGGSSSSYVSRGSRGTSTNGRDAGGSDGTVIDINSTEEQNKVKGDAQLCLTNQIDYFMQCIEIAIAQEYNVIQFDFYNDWMNGMLYIPRWFGRIRKKRQYLFGLINIPEKVYACMEGTYNNTRRYTQQCALEYKKDSEQNYTVVSSYNGCHKRKQECHRNKGKKNVLILGGKTTPGGGYVHDQKTVKGEYVYYFRPCDWLTGTNKKINYFATDIILLGSLSEHDMDGIPQTFKELTSSSYQMPTNLAETNMDKVGYMYGSSENGASICNGMMHDSSNSLVDYILRIFPDLANLYQGNDEAFLEHIVLIAELFEQANIDTSSLSPTELRDYSELIRISHFIKERNSAEQNGIGVVRIPDTYQAYVQWASTNEAGSDTYNDENEYPVTEAAGIDWGYTGPGQGEKDADKMYNPGGHFLGIACFNSETNVKSCVNLSRICEIGVSKSQRISIPKRSEDGKLVYDSFIVPTGLISKDEIMDTGFRSEFATLNHNGLKTKKNPLTNRLEYDFISMMPYNFDGSLSGKTGNILYNNLSGEYESPYSTAYKRTIENNSIDYYSFRLGIGNEDFSGLTVDDKYLIKNGDGSVSLPMYNNSYYFYFGLHDGETALDRFYKEFFATCPELNEDTAVVTISVTNVDVCNGGGQDGTVKVMFANISEDPFEPVQYSINRTDQDGVIFGGSTGVVAAGEGEFTVNGLIIGNYELRLSVEGKEDIVKEFAIGEREPDFVSKVEISVTDFNDTVYSNNITEDTDNRGYVVITWPDGTGINSVYVSGMTSDGQWNEMVESGEPLYLPDGNITYTVYATFMCGEFEREYAISTFVPYMPNKFDLVIGGSPLVTYNRTIRKLVPDTTPRWWEVVLNEGSSIEKFFTEKAITFKGSLFRNEIGSIDIVPKYGNVPYYIELTGTGEKLVGDGAELRRIEFGDSEDEGFDIDYQNFFYPTCNAPYRIGYEIVGGKKKLNYFAVFHDNDGLYGSSRIPILNDSKLEMPSIYKPFFFRCLIFRNCTDSSAEMQRVTYSIAVANGTLYSEGNNNPSFSAITICGVDVPEEGLIQERSNWWQNQGGDFNDFKLSCSEGDLPRSVKSDYSVYIKESEPEVGYQVLPPKSVSETIRFIGDSSTPDPGVRYFLVCRSTENGTRQRIGDNTSYVQVLNERLQNNIHYFKDGKLYEGQDDTGIYWSGSVSNAFKINIDDRGGYLIFSPKNELNRRNMFAGDISEIASTDRESDCFVLGVYDPWTILGDDEFAASQNRDSKYLYVGKDTDMLTVLKLYTVRDFIKSVENGGIYDDNNGSEDDRDENFTVQISSHSDTLRVSYGNDEHGTSVSSSQNVKLAEFNIDNYNGNKLITIPQLDVNLFGPYDGDDGLDYDIAFKLVNTNTGDYAYLRFQGEGTNTTGVSDYIRGETTRETIADDFDTGVMGRGIYALYMEYTISMTIPYDTVAAGGFNFRGGRITVRSRKNG